MRIIGVHGTGGNPNENWFPHLKEHYLGSDDVEVIVPQFPVGETQSLTTWTETFSNAVGEVNGDDVLVCHSIGCAFGLTVLSDPQLVVSPVAGTVLASGFIEPLGLEQFDGLNESFLANVWDWATIRHNAGSVVCFSGDDDPYVPVSLGFDLAGRLGVSATVVPAGGHLNSAAGFERFNDLVAAVDEIIGGWRAGNGIEL